MGASFSTQERLFVSQQWTELLEEAMSADVEAVSASAGNSAHKGSKHNETSFHMSFNEWQAFLGILEAGVKDGKCERLTGAALRQAGGAPSAICDQLAPAQLHCPLVPLTVHAFALWSGATTNATFLARLEKLEELVKINEEGEAMEKPEELAHEDSGSEPASSAEQTPAARPLHTDLMEESDEEDAFGDSADDGQAPDTDQVCDSPVPAPVPPPLDDKAKSRRQRLFAALKRRVAVKRKHNVDVSHGGDSGKKRGPRNLYLLNEYNELTRLFRSLVSELTALECGKEEETLTAERNGKGDESSAIAPPFDAAESPKMRAAFRDLKGASITDRPVAYVALCVGLAIYSALAPTPIYAVDGIAQLRRLDQAMRGQADGGNDETRQGPSRHASQHHGDDEEGGSAAAARAREPVTQRWPWVASLEAALVHKQHILDVQQCLGEDGLQLTKDFQRLRENRLVAESEKVSGGAAKRFAAMQPAERWKYCKSQYIGQRDIWDSLTSHFLSADIFDADKPTVVVFFGPSGYGKSELAKQVASAIHGCPVKDLEASGKMVYLHMPSFTTKESIYSLVDPPAAHVGDGILLSALHQHSDAVVVLDEFEKSTAEAVQNIWLSAFQKNGVLRSLKRADRSVSTVKTTFILTCNIAADVIEQDANGYLAATTTVQAQMRQKYQDVCKEVCRISFGDPFVNRVDYFYPFTPYSRLARQDYVVLTLERLLAAQEEKGRRVHVTPRCVAALVSKLKTFHASTLEEVLRPLLVSMSQQKCTEAVLTAESRAVAPGAAGYTAYVLLPCAPSPAATVETDVWEQLPDGEKCLAQWRRREESRHTVLTAKGGDDDAEKRRPISSTGEDTGAPCSSVQESLTTGGAIAASVTGERELALERLDADTEKLTNRELTLVTELKLARELLLKKDVEIATLKERVLMLEKVLAVMMCVVLCCTMAMYLLVGWKLTFVLFACVMGVVTVVLKVPLILLLNALGALFRFLGPVKSAILVLLMSVWVLQASKSVRCGN